MASANSTTSYLDPPQLRGVLNKDGTYTLSALDLKAQSDFNYYVAKIIQGGLNLANLNTETNTVFNSKVSFVDLSDPDSTTVINGGHITTGTISADRVTGGTLQGVEIISENEVGYYAVLRDGKLELYSDPYDPSTGLPLASFNIDSGSVVLQNMFSSNPLKIRGIGNMSIDATSGTIYIGASSGYSGNVDIGKSGGRVDINGSVYINGVLQ